jgi:hypothetical protein
MQPVYGVQLPSDYTGWLSAFSWVHIDIQELVVPSECLGGPRMQLLVGGLWPLFAVALLQLVLLVGDVAVAVWHKASLRSARVWKAGLLRGLPFAIFLSYCVLPSASRSTFQTWACESVEASDATGESVSFMRSDMSVECSGGVHSQLETISVIFSIIWPIGTPLCYLLLLITCRHAIRNRKPTHLSTATRFLYKEYEEQFFWWEPLLILHKLLLTSFILLVDSDGGSSKLARLLIGSLASVLFLTLTAMTRPYQRRADDALAATAQLMLSMNFISGIAIKICSSTDEGGAGWGECADIVGWESATQATLFMVVISATMLGLTLLMIGWQMATAPRKKLLRVRATKLAPQLVLSRHHTWHCFLSHIWSSGQDQVAVIKRQLQLLLPSLSIFLDVDDLADIGELESYISQSAVVLLFLSRGYFQVLYRTTFLRAPIMSPTRRATSPVHRARTACARSGRQR